MCKPTRPIQLIFDLLPFEFSKQDLMRLLKRHHRKYNPEGALQRFKVQGLIHNSTKPNHYFKTANT